MLATQIFFAKDTLPTVNPELVIATIYGEEEVKGRELITLDVKKIVMLLPVFPDIVQEGYNLRSN